MAWECRGTLRRSQRKPAWCNHRWMRASVVELVHLIFGILAGKDGNGGWIIHGLVIHLGCKCLFFCEFLHLINYFLGYLFSLQSSLFLPLTMSIYVNAFHGRSAETCGHAPIQHASVFLHVSTNHRPVTYLYQYADLSIAPYLPIDPETTMDPSVCLCICLVPFESICKKQKRRANIGHDTAKMYPVVSYKAAECLPKLTRMPRHGC